MSSASPAIIAHLREEIARREHRTRSGEGAFASGISAFDALLPGGGFLPGRVTELHGSPASGKNTLALMAVAQATRRGLLASYVDVGKELFPPALDALGTDLTRLLIVRPERAERAETSRAKGESDALRASLLLARSQAFSMVLLDLGSGVAPLCSPGELGRRSRQLLEAAERGGCALLLLAPAATGLDTTLRLSVERVAPWSVSVALERSRLGPPGRRAEFPLRSNGK